METLFEVIILLLLLINFRLIGTGKIMVSLKMLALQALSINILPWLTANETTTWILIVVIGSTIIKVGLLPWMLTRVMRQAKIDRESRPFVGTTRSLLIGLGLLGLSWLAADSLMMPVSGSVDTLLTSSALFTMLSGAYLLCTRRTAIMQVIGFLVLENGVYLFGVVFAIQEPWLVQAGVLLDLLAAVFVMGVMIEHINRAFAHIDTGLLSTLKD